MSDGLSETKSVGDTDKAQTSAPEGSGQPQPEAGPGQTEAQRPAEAATAAGGGSSTPAPAAAPAAVTSAAPEKPATAQPATAAASPAVSEHGFGWMLRQFFWMDERLAKARKTGYGPGDPGWQEFDLARGGLADATQLGESGEGQGSALLLYRAATALMMRAQLARAGVAVTSSTSNEECWSRLTALPVGATQQAALTGEQNEILSSALAQGDTYLAELPKEKRLPVARALARVAQGLGDPLEADAKRVGRVLISRWLRISVTALVLVVGGWYGVSKASQTPNLALRKSVTVGQPHPTYGRDTSLLVDGDPTNMGFHTVGGPNQTVTIDLGSVNSISKVVVYNRSDCCQERAVPLKVEVSEDNRNFTQVGERTEVFDRWTLKFSSVNARYVKLTSNKGDAFHLAEVEVY